MVLGKSLEGKKSVSASLASVWSELKDGKAATTSDSFRAKTFEFDAWPVFNAQVISFILILINISILFRNLMILSTSNDI